MTVTLTLDQGNSSTKLVTYHAATMAEVSCAVVNSPGEVRSALSGLEVAAAIGCTVSGGNLHHLLEASGAPVVMELDSTTPIELRNLYSTPQTLGADRLAAAAGARALMPDRDLLVADMGTACTFDFVTADGRYLGGNIAPGPGMRLRALNSFTARLPLVSGHGEVPAIGSNTADALRAGAMRGVVAELLYYSGRGLERAIILSGGWAPEIAALLPSGVTARVEPHLVNFGLNQILHYNQKLPK